MLLWFLDPAINAALCGMLGILALRSPNSNHIELHSKINFLFVVEDAAIGGAILFLAMMILFGWTLTRESFDLHEYCYSIQIDPLPPKRPRLRMKSRRPNYLNMPLPTKGLKRLVN